MSTWEKFLHKPHDDVLIQLALAHVEFETIHPFLDGNGRLGRMLIPLFLWQKESIARPVFYISAFFEKNRDSYYSSLRAVSQSNAWTEWCYFFLQAVKEQADDNITKAKNIIELYEHMKNRIVDVTRSQYAGKAHDWIFKSPIFSSTHFIKHSTIPPATARRFLVDLEKNEIIKKFVEGSGRTPTYYCFATLLNTVEGYDAF